MPSDDDKNDPERPSVQSEPGTTPRYAVSQLLQGSREAVLVHDGAEYRLRITSRGRLILTK